MIVGKSKVTRPLQSRQFGPSGPVHTISSDRTDRVIEHAGLRDTELPTGPDVCGLHSQMYEAWFGMIDPPRDYSVYDMSWVGPAASLISTVADLNRFYGLLLG